MMFHIQQVLICEILHADAVDLIAHSIMDPKYLCNSFVMACTEVSMKISLNKSFAFSLTIQTLHLFQSRKPSFLLLKTFELLLNRF